MCTVLFRKYMQYNDVMISIIPSSFHCTFKVIKYFEMHFITSMYCHSFSYSQLTCLHHIALNYLMRKRTQTPPHKKKSVFACILPRGARIITPKCVCAYPFRTSTALKIIRKPHAMRKTETNRSREPFSLFGVMILRLLYVFLVFHSHVHI